MNTKRTPGPWKRQGRYSICPRNGQGSCGGREICRLNRQRECVGELVGNATLIAAAPELLAALREIDALCDTVISGQPDAGTFAHNMARSLRAKARAALARAEGK